MPIPVLPPSSSSSPVPAGQPTVAERTPSLEVRATWRPERYTRLANGTFETDVAGWSVAAGINAAGTSVTRITTDARSGSACGRIVIPATVDAGANHDLGSQRWYADAGHSTLVVVKLWLKRGSGGRSVRVTIGSEGTVTARASIEVELLDEWQEYILTWRPQVSVTDAQLAIMSADGQAMTVLVDDVLVYSPLASQVDDGSFLTDTTGWVTDGSLIAGAATSLTRIPSDGMVDGSAELVTPASAGAGTDIALGSRLFRADMTHRLRIALRAIAGGDQVRLRLGSIGTPADRADATVTSTSTWTWHTLDWTPSVERTDVAVSVSAGAAAAMTVRLSEVEVYEALDELRPDSWEIVRGAAFDGTDVPGTMGGALPDVDGTYTPWHTGSLLYGAVKAMVPIMARATHGGRAHGLGWGRLTTVAPDPYGEHAHLTTSDGLRDLVAERISRPFRSDLAYAEARDAALTAAGVGHWPRDLDGGGPESGTFFDGTDTEVPALSYLTDLCSATGAVHVAVPSAHANVGWVYRTLNRARLTDATIAVGMSTACHPRPARCPPPGLDPGAPPLGIGHEVLSGGHVVQGRGVAVQFGSRLGDGLVLGPTGWSVAQLHHGHDAERVRAALVLDGLPLGWLARLDLGACPPPLDAVRQVQDGRAPAVVLGPLLERRELDATVGRVVLDVHLQRVLDGDERRDPGYLAPRVHEHRTDTGGESLEVRVGRHRLQLVLEPEFPTPGRTQCRRPRRSAR